MTIPHEGAAMPKFYPRPRSDSASGSQGEDEGSSMLPDPGSEPCRAWRR